GPENGSAVDRFGSVGILSSPPRWLCAECRRSMPSHRSVRLALRPPAQNRPGMSISPSNNTYILSPLSPSGKRKSPGASCKVSVSLRKSSAGFINEIESVTEPIERVFYLTSYDCVTADPSITREYIIHVLRVLRV